MSGKRKILVTGSKGFLASRLLAYYGERHEMTGMNHGTMDITDHVMVTDALKSLCPEYVIHCAAVSDIAACDRSPGVSQQINVDGAANVAEACENIGAKMIFCSSDQVYFSNGTGQREPHLETEEINPPHLYGRQKKQAEAEVLKMSPGAVCLRLSMMYAKDVQNAREHSNFLRNIVDDVRAGNEMSFPVHDYRSITDVWEVVSVMEQILALPGGIYNLGSENHLSTYDVVLGILKPRGLEYLLRKNEEAFAEKPRNLTMSLAKLRGQGIAMNQTMDGLEKNCRDLF